jgi:ribose transport system substrate-binding protein
MHSRLHAVRLAFVALPIVLTAGCSQSQDHAGEVYYLVATNTKLPYWQTAIKGLEQGAKDLGVRAEVQGPETYDPQEQVRAFRQLIDRKPAGIMVSAADPALMQPAIDAAIAAGIPVITMDSDAPASRRLFFIGTNNYQAGVTGGQILAKQMGGKGNVVVFTIPAQENLIQRLRGYEDSLAGTAIKIVQTVDIHGDPAMAFDKTMDIIQSGKLNVDGFVCLEATAGKEVAEVLSRRNVQGKTVVAMDTDEGTLEWVEKGMIAATVAQKPYTMAYYGLRALDDLHHHKLAGLSADWRQNPHAPVPSSIDTGSSLVTKENVSAIRQSARLYPDVPVITAFQFSRDAAF